MPPKQQKRPNNNHDNEEGEEAFQAVILTDSFEDQFQPISHELPRVGSFQQEDFVFALKQLTNFFTLVSHAPL